MRFAIWNLDLALRNFAYFRHSFLGYSKEYPTWLFFVIRKNEIFISVFRDPLFVPFVNRARDPLVRPFA